MKKTSRTIVFFGSGPVAAKSLALLFENFNIETVVTKTTPKHHKGDAPVLSLTKKLNIPVIQVANKKELDDVIEKENFSSMAGVLIDFGIIVSQTVINSFPLGIVNSHFSLLPKLRGADPITFSILSGQKQTGVSLMLLTAGMDEGPILAYAPFQLSPHINSQELTNNLIELSNALLTSVLPEYFLDGVTTIPQDSTAATYSRKLTKADSIIDWSKPADQLEREVRAFIEWPKSRAVIHGIDVVLIKTSVIDLSGKPGTTIVNNRLPVVFCGKDALVLNIVKPAGKKEMTGEAFLAGYKQRFLSN